MRRLAIHAPGLRLIIRVVALHGDGQGPPIGGGRDDRRAFELPELAARAEVRDPQAPLATDHAQPAPPASETPDRNRLASIISSGDSSRNFAGFPGPSLPLSRSPASSRPSLQAARIVRSPGENRTVSGYPCELKRSSKMTGLVPAARSQVKSQPLSSAPTISSRPSGESASVRGLPARFRAFRHSPDAASQIRTARSSPPVTTVLPSAENSRQRTGSKWASTAASRSRPVRTSQKCKVVGPPLAATVAPSGENAQAVGDEVGHSNVVTIRPADRSWTLTFGQSNAATSRPSAEKAAS